MRKFVLYHEKLGYFKPGNSGSLHYNDTDFISNIEKAYWYNSEKTATNKALGLYPRIPVLVMPIEITIARTMNPIDVAEKVKKDLAKHQARIDAVSELTSEETEALSVKKWNEYKFSKKFVRRYTEELG